MDRQSTPPRSLQAAAIWIAIAALVFLLWRIRLALQFGIGVVTVANLLRAMATSIVKLTHISAKFWLAAVDLPEIAVIGVTIWRSARMCRAI